MLFQAAQYKLGTSIPVASGVAIRAIRPRSAASSPVSGAGDKVSRRYRGRARAAASLMDRRPPARTPATAFPGLAPRLSPRTTFKIQSVSPPKGLPPTPPSEHHRQQPFSTVISRITISRRFSKTDPNSKSLSLSTASPPVDCGIGFLPRPAACVLDSLNDPIHPPPTRSLARLRTPARLCCCPIRNATGHLIGFLFLRCWKHWMP